MAVAGRGRDCGGGGGDVVLAIGGGNEHVMR